MRRIAGLRDPLGLMNPGKVIWPECPGMRDIPRIPGSHLRALSDRETRHIPNTLHYWRFFAELKAVRRASQQVISAFFVGGRRCSGERLDAKEISPSRARVSPLRESAKKRKLPFAGWAEGCVVQRTQSTPRKPRHHAMADCAFRSCLAALGQNCQEERMAETTSSLLLHGMLGSCSLTDGRQNPNYVMVQTDSGRGCLYKAVIEAIQRRLADGKYYTGNKDGVFSTGT